jgi:hypothetical protein
MAAMARDKGGLQERSLRVGVEYGDSEHLLRKSFIDIVIVVCTQVGLAYCSARKCRTRVCPAHDGPTNMMYIFAGDGRRIYQELDEIVSVGVAVKLRALVWPRLRGLAVLLE